MLPILLMGCLALLGHVCLDGATRVPQQAAAQVSHSCCPSSRAEIPAHHHAHLECLAPACLTTADGGSQAVAGLPAPGYEAIAAARLDPLGILYPLRPQRAASPPNDPGTSYYDPRQLERVRVLLI
ncbi:MAG: hypothetical protein GWO39_01015 [Gammaproteobacteria bacterium]|nr:hypothetical protein [Gammaproteobacteria bacterium]NIY30997.1 hypothetical protein [Gammaproteobacteria bacterium]